MNHLLPVTLSLLLLFTPQDRPAPRSSGGPLLPEQACYEVLHYRLTLRIRPDERSLEGDLVMKARVTEETDRIAMDLDDAFTVSEVTAGDRSLGHEHEDGRIDIRLPTKAKEGDDLEIKVAYRGKPRVAPRPPWDGGFTWARTKDGRPWIATSCQVQGADLWWPCKDHPSDKPETMDLHITVPEGLVCASNGTLQSDRKNGDGTRTFHWRIANPISNYNVALNIAPYKVIKASWKSVGGEKVPFHFYALPESVEQARKAIPLFIQEIRSQEYFLGPYPFRNEKYGIAETPHLGMEHQTIIAYGNRFQGTKGGYDWLHHHESAHEWWGNLVTNRDWKDMWIHEGFGTYMQALHLERLRGKDAYDRTMEDSRGRFEDRAIVAPREAKTAAEIYTGHGIYSKGAWVLHTLRWVLGDEVFFKTLRRFLYPTAESEEVTDGSQVRFVDTDDFLAEAEKHSGMELDWFFEVYLRQPALPELIQERKGGKLHLEWRVPGELPFPMPVPVRVGEATLRVEMKDGAAVVEIPSGKKVAVDPRHRVLKDGSAR